MPVRLPLALCAALALLAFPAEKAGAQGGWALFIHAASDDAAPCVTAADVASRIGTRTGATLTVLEKPLREQSIAGIEHWIEARMVQRGDAAALALVLRDRDDGVIGERMLEQPPGAQCDELRDAAVLAIAVMMGKGESLLAPAPEEIATEPPPSTDTPQPAREPEPAPTPEALASPPRTAPAEPMPAQRPPAYRAPLHARVFAGAAIAADVVPGISAHATITLRVIHAFAWPLELSLAYFGTSEAELGGASEGRVSYRPLYGVLATCPFGAGSGALRADACIGVLAGTSFTQASGFTEKNGDSVLPLAGIALRLPVSLRIAGSLSLRAAAMLGTPLMYNEVTARDSADTPRVVAETSPLFGGLDLALGIDLF